MSQPYNYYPQPSYQPPINQPYPTLYRPQIPQGPSPVPYDPAAYSTHPHISTPRPHRHRRRESTPSAAAPPPLKSALKKTNTYTATPGPQPPIEFPITRPRSNSFSQQPHGFTRPRVYSNSAYPQNDIIYPSREEEFTPLHMFLSFHGYNELHLEGITELALKELRSKIWNRWADGIESDTVDNHRCIVRFKNAPWDMGGPKYLLALKLILELFSLCAQRGYAFQTSVNIGTHSPRLIFQVLAPDLTSQFFVAYFSQGGRRLTLINPPGHIDLSIGAMLKDVLRSRISADYVVDENIRVIEVRKKAGGFTGAEVEPAHFLMHVLKIISNLGFQLDAAIPLLRRGQLGMRSSREILIFKGSNPG